MAVTIQIRRDTTANWTSVNPTPAAGEICFDTTLLTFKIGDGATAWLTLTAYSKIPVSAAADDMLFGDGTTGNWVKKTLADAKTALGLGAGVAASTAESDFLLGDSTTGNWKKGTLAEARTALGLGGTVEASTAVGDMLVADSTTGNWKKETAAGIRTLLSLDAIDGGGA